MEKIYYATLEFYRQDGAWVIGDSSRDEELDRLGERGWDLVSTVVFNDEGLSMLTDTYRLK